MPHIADIPVEAWAGSRQRSIAEAGLERWQFLPESYDRSELDHAVAAVPLEVLTRGPLLWGTPEQAVRRVAPR
jgi:hypothetical protein